MIGTQVASPRLFYDFCLEPVLDLSVSPGSRLAYADLFTPEGRIATRLTPARAAIVKKLRALGQLSDAAKTYWTKRKGRLSRGGRETHRHGRGIENSPNGFDVYKGENIRTGSLVWCARPVRPQLARQPVVHGRPPSAVMRICVKPPQSQFV
jgi:hypothetical protein